MFDVQAITNLHRNMVVRWHERQVDAPHHGWLGIVCRQHGYNFRLWHQEDIARSPDATDAEIAEVKRNIDRLNQQRNDHIEKVDDYLTEELERRGVVAEENAPLNTETPGSVIDRLSILSLRVYHLQEQLERPEVSREHVENVQRKIAVCCLQHEDLSHSLGELLDDIFAGRKRHRTYRQFKMYNDPALNPYLYGQGAKAA